MDEEVALRRVGSTLRGKYRVDALVGIGGMAAVYRGEHRNGNRVAIKILHPIWSSSDARARFLREGYVANKVDHPGAVRVLDDDTAEDGAPFLVMELLDGESLDARWERANRRMRPKDVAELMYQLLDVLIAAHAKGIIHRDIKPDNLFVTRRELKVLDFGIARMRDGTNPYTTTRDGSTMGTPAFMPPEQALGKVKEIDARTDVWAVGATMFTLISGQYVHEAETYQEMMVSAATKPSRSILTVSGDVPAPLAAVIDRALQANKSARFEDAQAMQRALVQAYETVFAHRMSGLEVVRAETDLAPVGESSTSAKAIAPIAPTLDATEIDAGTTLPATVVGTEIAAPLQSKSARGLSTTAGVASDRRLLPNVAHVETPSRTAPSSSSKTRNLFVVGAVLVVAVIGALVVARFAVRPTMTALPADPTLSPVPAASVASPTSSLLLPAPTSSQEGIAVTRPLASTVQGTAGSTLARPPPATQPRPPSSPTAPSAGPAPPKPNCNPDYTIDEKGKKKWKPECWP